MANRTMAIYLLTLVLVRLGSRRLLAKPSPGAALAVRMHWLSVSLEGTRVPLVRDGEVLREGMRRANARTMSWRRRCACRCTTTTRRMRRSPSDWR
jgi:hypothetical protein